MNIKQIFFSISIEPTLMMAIIISIINSSLLYLIPYRSRSFFNNYYTTLNQIIIRRNRSKIWQIYFLIFCSVCTSISVFISSQIKPLGQFFSFIFCDLITLIFEQNDNHLHFVLLSLFIMTIYLTQVTYLKVDRRLFPLIKPFVDEIKCDSSVYEFDFIKPINCYFRGRDVRQLNLNVSIFIANALQVFTFIADFLMFYNLWKFIQLTIVYYDQLFDNYLIGWFLYEYHWYNLLMWNISMFTLINSCLLSGTISLSILYNLYIRLHQNLALIGWSKQMIRWTTFRTFIRNDLHTFCMIFIFNRMYGRMLAIFILINTPTNAYLITRLVFMHESFNKITMIVCCTLVVAQNLCIGIIHLFFFFF